MKTSRSARLDPLDSVRQRLDGPFFVANSDIYTDLDLTRVLVHPPGASAPLTVVVTKQMVNIAYGVLEHHGGRVVDFKEKPTQEYSVSTGIYCMEPESSSTSREPRRSDSMT